MYMFGSILESPKKNLIERILTLLCNFAMNLRILNVRPPPPPTTTTSFIPVNVRDLRKKSWAGWKRQLFFLRGHRSPVALCTRRYFYQSIPLSPWYCAALGSTSRPREIPGYGLEEWTNRCWFGPLRKWWPLIFFDRGGYWKNRRRP